MESDPEKKRKKKRRCSVCRLPVKGHPGPYGRGRCTFERPEGTSDEDFFGRQRGSANVQEKIRGLRRHSKVPELVRKAWSDSLSEDAEEEVRLSRSYNLKKSSDYGGEKASVRARSEPPPQVSRQNARDRSREYAQVKDQPDIRDLRESRKLVKEVDKALDDWLHPVTSQERRISDKCLDESDFDSTSTSSQTESGRSSDTEESAYTRKPERRRRRRGSRKKKTEARDPPQTLSSDTTESESGFVRKPDKRKRRRGSRKKRSATRVGGKKKEKGKRSRRNYDSDTSSYDSRSRSRRRRRAGKSGRNRTINDSGTRRVKVDWPQHRVHFPGYGKEGGVTYDELSLPMFVHGYVKNVLDRERVSTDAEHKLVHLADLMFDAVYYDWVAVREVHASLLYGMEYGSLAWGNRGAFDAVRERHYRTQARVARGNAGNAPRAGLVKEARVSASRPRYCGEFQTGSCSLPSGHWSTRWNAPLLHVCSACLIVREIQAPHPSQECQHKPRPFRGPADRANRSFGNSAHFSQGPGPARGGTQGDQAT
ncbi:PREDICTED: uncharacterized protein LOC109481685 [Branchiostoma belcheri]|uniref:Uncharacterized protein LOC109481685 n=1 Tax=Branchiostoma belcheri TaxID=7741 RepID=A0A6P4ZF22_BRABE|nr:PREDICTED: uncharacterized protein LOC109481685 [Branchiostoma belcheri]XP_019639831.1 PREDICTED: uncharacterized protein LOC109481685 [Branchiostoma belcheri]